MKVSSINGPGPSQVTENATNQRMKTLKANALKAWSEPGGTNAEEVSPGAAAALGGAAVASDATPTLADVVESQGQEGTVEASAPDAQTEAPVEVEAQKPAETATDPLSSKYAALAKQERALRAKAQQQEQAIKAREEALTARESQLGVRDNEYKTGYIKADTLKSNPLQALAEAGISYDDLTNQILNQGSVDPRVNAQFEALQNEIKNLREERVKERQAQEEHQTTAYKQAIAKIETDAKKMVFTDPAFEMIKATNSIKDVVQLIESHYKETGEVLTVQEAGQQVEDYLTEEAFKLASSEKIRKKLQPVAPVAAQVPNTQTPPSQATKAQTPPTTKTLTNASSVPRKLSAKERAHMAFRGEKI